MIDVEKFDELIAYLRNAHRIPTNETPRIEILRGGVSNKTVLLIRCAGESWVIKQALSKLRVQSDWFSDPARIQVEAAGLRHLPRIAPEGSITPLIFEDPDQNLIAMMAVPKPHENWKEHLLAGYIDPDHFRKFAEIVGSIHRGSTQAVHEFSRLFATTRFFQTLRLEPYYERTAEVVPEATSFLRELVRSTLSRSHALVHGDASPKNVLIHGGSLVLLDHEVLHFGDPAFDIGFSLTHFLSKAHHLPDLRQRLEEGARLFWNVYQKEVQNMPWFEDLVARAPMHTLAALLARVCGRSPLEYLRPSERVIQKHVVIQMMAENHSSIDDLISSFIQRVQISDISEHYRDD